VLPGRRYPDRPVTDPDAATITVRGIRDKIDAHVTAHPCHRKGAPNAHVTELLSTAQPFAEH
jgi:hypothetical protein